MLVSIVIRTLNEARYLGQLLEGIRQQVREGFDVETVVIDSGSEDETVAIAREHGCVITSIRREEFSFGRSLNLGCEAASGDILVFVSGHCVPTDEHWLGRLCAPVMAGEVGYAYGRQIGGSESRFSECRIFEKYFPAQSRVPQAGFFCNNANSALSRAAWRAHRFDEDLTGLEDMELAKRLCEAGGRVGYVADACVYHYHHERWPQVKRRFEREALALQKIMPQIHVSPIDTLRYIASSIVLDWRQAHREGRASGLLGEIVRYRVAQYLGSYRGNHEHRRLSKAQKDIYFYPSNRHQDHEAIEIPSRRPSADEGQQRAGAR
ncbi:MAG: glycosyltransferase [Burkholderiaceae bacterium]